MRVIIADDHRIVRDGLRLILAHDPDISIVAEVEDGASLLEALVTTPADVVLLDVKMPGLSGLDVLEHLQTMPLDVKVVILSMHDDPVYVKRAIELGASGYLLKSVGREELFKALHAIAAGRSYVQGELTGPLVAQMVSGGSGRSMADIGLEERRLLELLAAGCCNEAIAAELNLSESAVKARLHRLYTALGVTRRSQAVAVGIRMGLVT